MKNENNINVRNANRMPLWVRRTALSLCAAALLCSVPHVQAEEAAQAPKHKITFAVTCTRVGSGTLTTTAYSTGNNVSPAKHNVRLEIPYESAVSTPVENLITIDHSTEEAASPTKHNVRLEIPYESAVSTPVENLITIDHSTEEAASPAKHNVRLEIPYESAVSTPVASLITIERTPSQPVTEHRYVECDEDM